MFDTKYYFSFYGCLVIVVVCGCRSFVAVAASDVVVVLLLNTTSITWPPFRCLVHRSCLVPAKHENHKIRHT